MNAHDILAAAAGHMKDRAATYDTPEGERSMGATVEAFKAVTGVEMTEEQGWLFMALLKSVRSQQGGYRADSYEDGVAYFALAGEAACRDRKKPIKVELYDNLTPAPYQTVILAGHEIDTAFDTEHRIELIGTNGNEGEHYAEVDSGWIENTGDMPDLPDRTRITVEYRCREPVHREVMWHDQCDWHIAGHAYDIIRYRILDNAE